MKNKCINCEHMGVQERNYYDSDNVRRTEVKYVCALTGIERDIMCTRACEGFKKRKRG